MFSIFHMFFNPPNLTKLIPLNEYWGGGGLQMLRD